MATISAVKHLDQRKVNYGKHPASKGFLHPLSKVNKIGRKAVSRNKSVAVSMKTRQQKIEALRQSVELLIKDNNRLRLVCRYVLFINSFS